jgi:uncharacterized repeat protein (TIGR03803 family)
MMTKTIGAVAVLAAIGIASYAIAASSNATIYSFGTAVGDGAQPKGTLTDVNGILFGRTTATFKVVTNKEPARETSTNKGVKLGGVIFSLDPSDSTYTILHTFPASKHDGENPRHDAMTLFNGVLYGSTLQGGKGGGTIFSINGDGTGYAKLDDLASKTGDQQHSCFVVINNVLYAMTAAGGSHKHGVIYSVNPDGSNFTVLHDFKSSEGDEPHGRLTDDGTHLYGMTKSGVIEVGSGPNSTQSNPHERRIFGTIFQVDPDGSNYNILHYFFGGAKDGATTDHGYLVLDANDVLYGMTTLGGSANKGVIFSFNNDGSEFTLLHTFAGGTSDGANPYGSLLINGTDLYGTTASGGTSNKGTVFHLSTDGNNFSILHSFAGNPDGEKPIDNVIMLNNTLYGMTVFGGTYNEGAIFAIPLQ